jgi:DTW domain-containing protein YfiP
MSPPSVDSPSAERHTQRHQDRTAAVVALSARKKDAKLERGACPRCYLDAEPPADACVCDLMTPLPAPHAVTCFVHATELYKTSSTHQLLLRGLQHSELCVWHSDAYPTAAVVWEHVLQQCAASGRTPAVLYPSPTAIPATEFLARLSPERRRRGVHVVVLDGTWHNVSAMNTELPASAPRIVVSPPPTYTLFGPLRAPPTPGRVSTLEAVACLFDELRSSLRPTPVDGGAGGSAGAGGGEAAGGCGRGASGRRRNAVRVLLKTTCRREVLASDAAGAMCAPPVAAGDSGVAAPTAPSSAAAEPTDMPLSGVSTGVLAAARVFHGKPISVAEASLRAKFMSECKVVDGSGAASSPAALARAEGRIKARLAAAGCGTPSSVESAPGDEDAKAASAGSETPSPARAATISSEALPDAVAATAGVVTGSSSASSAVTVAAQKPSSAAVTMVKETSCVELEVRAPAPEGPDYWATALRRYLMVHVDATLRQYTKLRPDVKGVGYRTWMLTRRVPTLTVESSVAGATAASPFDTPAAAGIAAPACSAPVDDAHLDATAAAQESSSGVPSPALGAAEASAAWERRFTAEPLAGPLLSRLPCFLLTAIAEFAYGYDAVIADGYAPAFAQHCRQWGRLVTDTGDAPDVAGDPSSGAEDAVVKAGRVAPSAFRDAASGTTLAAAIAAASAPASQRVATKTKARGARLGHPITEGTGSAAARRAAHTSSEACTRGDAATDVSSSGSDAGCAVGSASRAAIDTPTADRAVALAANRAVASAARRERKRKPLPPASAFTSTPLARTCVALYVLAAGYFMGSWHPLAS